METNSKHLSALDDLTTNFTPFLKEFIDDVLTETSNKDKCDSIFAQFLYFAIFSSAEQLRHLKRKVHQETSTEEHQSFLRLDEIICDRSITSDIAEALDIFMDTLPQYVKNTMFESGFHTLEIEETHTSYISLYSSFIVAQIDNLHQMYSNLYSIENKSPNPLQRCDSGSDFQSSNGGSVQLVKTTRKHCIYRDSCSNRAIKVLISDNPSVKELEHLENELNITKLIMHPSIRPSLSKTIFESRKALTMEWTEGYALSEISKSYNFGIKDFLEIAREIVSVLVAMHKEHIMHMNLTCDHIILNPESMSVKVIGFGSSSKFNSKIHHISNQELFEKDLRYISPEQTGKVNREVNFQSDFYSLGIVFYVMLTGKHPFEDDDPSKLLNMHIFQEPLPVCSINQNVPIPISMMVSILMKKEAELRYQSAKGLIFDLDLMLSEYESNRNLSSVVLAQNDMPQTLLIPQKLYGRSTEFDALLSVINRSNTSSFELIFVSGTSGTGKSSLVFELYKSITERKGFLIFGKHDLKITEPYFAILEAMKGFCNDLLFKDETTTSNIKNKIIEALGEEANILTDVIQNLHLIIGRQSSTSDTCGQDAKNQFNYVFIKFIKAICSYGVPIVLVLDDLQWMDLQSLDLLSALIKDKTIENLTLIGTYRDNEVSEEHPLSVLLQNVKRSGVNATNIKLENLDHETINGLISHALCHSPLDTYSLTALIYEKTSGNPFFVNQMLKSLFEQGLLFFCNESNKWKWNVSNESKMAENVLELLRLKILQLDEVTQQTLKAASCLGSPFSLNTLKLIVNSNKGIEGAINSEIITQYKGSSTIYRFAHDQIQCAAYSLLPSDSREIFLYIG